MPNERVTRHLDHVTIPARDLVPSFGEYVESRLEQKGVGLVMLEVDLESLRGRVRDLGLEIAVILDGYLPIGRVTVLQIKEPQESDWHLSIYEVNSMLYTTNYQLDDVMEILMGGSDESSTK